MNKLLPLIQLKVSCVAKQIAVESWTFFNVLHLLCQLRVNDLVVDWGLIKEKPYLLGSKLKLWNLLHGEVKCSHFLKGDSDCFDPVGRETVFLFVVLLKDSYVRWRTTNILKSEERRLFVDSIKVNLEEVSLLNSNQKTSIPQAYAAA